MSEKNRLPENVILGPWKERKERPENEQVRIAQLAQAVADDFTMKLMQQVIGEMKKKGMDINETSFIRDAAMIYEMVQGTIYRDRKLSHPTHNFVEEFVHVNILPEDVIETEIDFAGINALVDLLEDVDDPEIS